jgi:hypothetical protein
MYWDEEGLVYYLLTARKHSGKEGESEMAVETF